MKQYYITPKQEDGDVYSPFQLKVFLKILPSKITKQNK